MSDILSQGGEPGPRRPWRRWMAVLAALAVVVVVVVEQHPGHRPAPRRPGVPGSLPAVGGIVGDPAAAPAGPDGITGPTRPWSAQLRLPVGGAQPAWLWPATGRTQLIGGLPPDPAGYQFARAGGGWVITPGPAAGQCGSCAGLPGPVYFLGDQAGAATRIGQASTAAPAAAPRAVWLISYLPGADPGASSATAQQVSSTGAAIGPRLRLPAGYLIVRGTAGGLLLAPLRPRANLTADRLWNPAAPRGGREFPGVVAAGPGQVAWGQQCTPRCRLQVLNLATGRTTRVVLPAGSSAAGGTFSPDGQLLALQVSSGPGGDGGGQAIRLGVAAAASGRLTLVPGTFVSSDALAGFGWPGAGHSLVAELSFTTKVQLAAWQPGAARLAVVAVAPRQRSAALVTG
ncbi:MAG TPA: hypothetical protein VGG35_11860 [Streptosporangiaceae bacterium]|jgi:hypothetical protein